MVGEQNDSVQSISIIPIFKTFIIRNLNYYFFINKSFLDFSRCQTVAMFPRKYFYNISTVPSKWALRRMNGLIGYEMISRWSRFP